MDMTAAKSSRLLYIYSHLSSGEILQKTALADKFRVTPKSIQRDIDSLRCFYADERMEQEIIYDRSAKGYRLIDTGRVLLSNDEILAVCKILLESRSMIRGEMEPILDKLLENCAPIESYKALKAMIANEKLHYIEPRHGKEILSRMWALGTAINNRSEIRIKYRRMKEPALVERVLHPVGLMFSEYYFYLVAYIDGIDKPAHFENPDDPYPTIYRVDRIESVETTGKSFFIPYRDRFEEGEFRKHVQFMYGGRLRTVTFLYTGPSVEAVLDRLPSAQILEWDDKGWLVRVEVFGDGIDMWLRSQGENVRVIEKR